MLFSRLVMSVSALHRIPIEEIRRFVSQDFCLLQRRKETPLKLTAYAVE